MCRAELLTWQWDSELSGRFQRPDGKRERGKRHLLSVTASNERVVFVSHQPSVIEIDCYHVRRELSDYLEDDLAPQLRLQIEDHLQSCDHCRAVYDGLRNVVRLLGDEQAIELPEGFSQRLYRRLFPAR